MQLFSRGEWIRNYFVYSVRWRVKLWPHLSCKSFIDLSGYTISQCFLFYNLISLQSRGVILGFQTRLKLTEFWHSFPDHYAVLKMGIMLVKVNYSL